MSRVGKMPVSLPSQGVEITVSKSNLVTVKGPKGTLSQQVHPDLVLEMDNGALEVKPTDQKRHREMHGLTRSLIHNMVVGVSEGFVKELELVGVGYRASNETMKQLLELSLGYSSPDPVFYVPSEVKVEAKQEKGKNPIIRLESHDKQLIGQIAAKIRAFRKPEPYKGKGVRFVGEEIRRKAGKTAGKGKK